MPVHDWTRVDAGLFHHFHHRWIDSLTDALNAGSLPPDYFALVEQRIRGPIPDVLTLRLEPALGHTEDGNGGLAVTTAPPRAKVVKQSEAEVYAKKASRITVRHRHGQVVAVVEIVSPGNKDSDASFRTFVQKSADLVYQGVHLLVIDVFPPGPRDPQGIAKALWDQFKVEEIDQPADKPLSFVSFDAGGGQTLYADFVAVGEVLPSMSLFLKPEIYIPAPLEESYQAAWAVFPRPLKRLLDSAAGA